MEPNCNLTLLLGVGSHTFDTIASRLDAIMKDYGIQGRVTSVVTDNGSNIVKVFRVFSKKQVEVEEIEEDGDCSKDSDVDFDYSSVTENEDEEDTTLSAWAIFEENQHKDTSSQATVTDDDTTVQVEQDNSDGSESEVDEASDESAPPPKKESIVLPPHLWCASHNLSLIATTDFENAIKGNVVYKLSYKRVIAKMKALWNKTSRSVQASDDMYEILVRYLPRPGKTRWNSLFDSVRTLAEQDPKKINDLLTQLKIPNVTNTDQIFISEFLSLMSPIAISWNALQGEKNFFLGCVLPLLIRLKEKLSSLKLSNSGGKLRDVLISKIDQRFGCDDHIVAAVTHPKFKLHWISDSEEKTKRH